MNNKHELVRQAELKIDKVINKLVRDLGGDIDRIDIEVDGIFFKPGVFVTRITSISKRNGIVTNKEMSIDELILKMVKDPELKEALINKIGINEIYIQELIKNTHQK